MLFLLSFLLSSAFYTLAFLLCLYDSLYLYRFYFLFALSSFLHAFPFFHHFSRRFPSLSSLFLSLFQLLFFFFFPSSLLSSFLSLLSPSSSFLFPLLLHPFLSSLFLLLMTSFSLDLSTRLSELQFQIDVEMYVKRIKGTIIALTMVFYALTMRALFIEASFASSSASSSSFLSFLPFVFLLLLSLLSLVSSLLFPRSIISDSAVLSHLLTSSWLRCCYRREEFVWIDQVWMKGMEAIMVIVGVGYCLQQYWENREKEEEEEEVEQERRRKDDDTSSSSSRSSSSTSSSPPESFDWYVFLRLAVFLLLLAATDTYILPYLRATVLIERIHVWLSDQLVLVGERMPELVQNWVQTAAAAAAAGAGSDSRSPSSDLSTNDAGNISSSIASPADSLPLSGMVWWSIEAVALVFTFASRSLHLFKPTPD